MKVIAFGSCMSNLTITYLASDYGWEQTHSVHHNRNDSFIRYFIDQSSEMISKSFFDDLLIYKESTEREARMFLRNQYRETVGFHDLPVGDSTFFEDLETNSYDVILLDNFMDVSSKLLRHRSRKDLEQSPIFLNPGFYKNSDEVIAQFDWFCDFLTPIESARNWLRIYQWLRAMQPSAKIIFLPFHSCSSVSSPDRFRRIHDFYPALVDVATAERGLIIIPPLNVSDELTKGPIDWPHFQPPIYKALAGLVYLHTVGGW
jgi:hypothetical protein